MEFTPPNNKFLEWGKNFSTNAICVMQQTVSKQEKGLKVPTPGKIIHCDFILS